MKAGTQIAYIPMHANGNINHRDVEFGFVTSVRKDTAFCRYWRKGEPGKLRTLANSEGTPLDMVVPHQSVSRFIVDKMLKIINLGDALGAAVEKLEVEIR